MKKIIFSIQILFVTLMLSSCLHDDNVVFDEPAAQRVERPSKPIKHYWSQQLMAGCFAFGLKRIMRVAAIPI